MAEESASANGEPDGESPATPAGSDRSAPSSQEALDRLYAVQTSTRERRALTLVAVVLGIAVATLHWSGLVVGGALVGICQPTLRRALVTGLGFGVLVLAVVAAWFALAGSLGAALAMGQITGVAVGAGLVGGIFGALTRGLLPDAS